MDSATKRPTVFIGQRMLTHIAGSEVVTYELAQHFSRTHDVLIGTMLANESWTNLLESLPGVRVLELGTKELSEAFQFADINLAWIHHGVLPKELLEKAADILFIFHHMSGKTQLELPFMPSVEERLAARILFNSEESLDEVSEKAILKKAANRFSVLGNPAPDNFFREEPPLLNKELKRILVVSNHVPDDLATALDLLDNIEIVRFGEASLRLANEPRDSINEYRLVTPEDITSVDAVISIGKTVQYALVAGVPVYCYDHFGGPGWLDFDNFERARYFNFSGRGFEKKSSQDIVDELLSGFPKARESALELHQLFAQEFLLSNSIDELIENAQPIGNELPQSAIEDYSSAFHLNTLASIGWDRLSDYSKSFDSALAEQTMEVKHLLAAREADAKYISDIEAARIAEAETLTNLEAAQAETAYYVAELEEARRSDAKYITELQTARAADAKSFETLKAADSKYIAELENSRREAEKYIADIKAARIAEAETLAILEAAQAETAHYVTGLEEARKSDVKYIAELEAARELDAQHIVELNSAREIDAQHIGEITQARATDSAAFTELTNVLAATQTETELLQKKLEEMEIAMSEKISPTQRLGRLASAQFQRGKQIAGRVSRRREVVENEIHEDSSTDIDVLRTALEPLFDRDYYLTIYPDVAESGLDPFVHFLENGHHEGREPSPLFDHNFYLAKYPDVAEAGVDPLLHFLEYGRHEGRQGSPSFDPNFYLATYSDVASAGLEPHQHYHEYGRHEGRQIRPASASVGGTGAVTSTNAPSAADLISIYEHSTSTFQIAISPDERKRINLVTDSLGSGSLLGGVATSLIIAILWAKSSKIPLRIVTRQQFPDPTYLGGLLDTIGIKPEDLNIEFAYASEAENIPLPVSRDDEYLTTSWWTTQAVLNVVSPSQVVYLIQEDERSFYPIGDQSTFAQQIMNHPGIRTIINTSGLYDHLVTTGIPNIADTGIAFEPSFEAFLVDGRVLRDEKRHSQLVAYARPNHPRNLYHTLLKALEWAAERGGLDPKQWNITLLGSDAQPFQLSNGNTARTVGHLSYNEYRDLLHNSQVGISLMASPHPSYPPYDLAAGGSVVVTNTWPGKPSLKPASERLIECAPDYQSIGQAILDAQKLVCEVSEKPFTPPAFKMYQSWQENLGEVIELLRERTQDDSN